MERVAAPLKLKTWNLQRHIKSIGWSELASDTLGEIVPEYHQFQLSVASLEYYYLRVKNTNIYYISNQFVINHLAFCKKQILLSWKFSNTSTIKVDLDTFFSKRQKMGLEINFLNYEHRIRNTFIILQTKLKTMRSLKVCNKTRWNKFDYCLTFSSGVLSESFGIYNVRVVIVSLFSHIMLYDLIIVFCSVHI